MISLPVPPMAIASLRVVCQRCCTPLLNLHVVLIILSLMKPSGFYTHTHGPRRAHTHTHTLTHSLTHPPTHARTHAKRQTETHTETHTYGYGYGSGNTRQLSRKHVIASLPSMLYNGELASSLGRGGPRTLCLIEFQVTSRRNIRCQVEECNMYQIEGQNIRLSACLKDCEIACQIKWQKCQINVKTNSKRRSDNDRRNVS